MVQLRRRNGFERAGTLSVRELGLPVQRARELVSCAAWRRVAGEAIASRTSVRIRRGVLEIRVSDEHWAATLTDLIPRIAGRLAADYPDLGVRKFRLIRAGSPETAGAVPLD
jgi:predicted nucleic acid-binding Zn ribbon protein